MFFLFFSFHFRRTSRIPLYEFGPVEAVTIGSVDLALLLTFAFWQQKYLMILILSLSFLLWKHLGLNFILKKWRFSSTGSSYILCGKILCKPLCIVLPMHLHAHLQHPLLPHNCVFLSTENKRYNLAWLVIPKITVRLEWDPTTYLSSDPKQKVDS